VTEATRDRIAAARCTGQAYLDLAPSQFANLAGFGAETLAWQKHLLVRGELLIGGKDMQGEKVSKLVKELAPSSASRTPVPIQALPPDPASTIQQAVSCAIAAAPVLATAADGSPIKVIARHWLQLYIGVMGVLAGLMPDKHLTAKRIQEVLQQLCMEQLRYDMLSNHGVDLARYAYVPEVWEETGELMACIEDEGHKVKNLAQGWHGQPSQQLTPEGISKQAEALLFCKAAMLDVVQRHSPQYNHHLAAITGSGDRQRNAPVVQLFTDSSFQHACWDAGYRRMAVAFKVFGEAFMAHDTRAWSAQHRCIAMHHRNQLCAQLLRPYTLQGRSSMPATVQGVSTQCLFALWYNGCALQHVIFHMAVRAAAPHMPASMSLLGSGVSTPWLPEVYHRLQQPAGPEADGDVEVSSQLEAAADDPDCTPPVALLPQLPYLNTRATSTNHLECMFGRMAQVQRYKCLAKDAVQVLSKVEYLADLTLQPDGQRGFYYPAAAARKRSYDPATMEPFNSGTADDPQSAGMQHCHLVQATAARRVAKHGAFQSVRSHHAPRA
jgi:hypothetical protein